MKINSLIIFVLAMCGLFSAVFAHAKINVVTTTEDLAVIAKEVGGDKIEATSLAKGYQDPHFVDAKPSYLVKLRRADLFVEVGRDLEAGWALSLLNSARNPKILMGASGFLDASLHVPIMEIPTGSVSRAEGDVHPFGNPHYWIDPNNGRWIAEEIEQKLANSFPENSSFFHDRAENFKKRLKDSIAMWEEKSKKAGIEGIKAVTYHQSWSYFAKWVGLEVVGFIEPKPGIPPSPRHIQSLISQMKSQGVKLIIVEPYFDIKLPQKIAYETGAKLVVLPPSVGAEKAILSYFDLFDRLIDVLSQALAEGGE